MNAWNIIVIVAGVLLLLFICRQEFIRANKARLLWRMIASVLAGVCLVCMGLPLTFTPASTQRTDEAIVITVGANEDSIQYFNKSQKEKLAVYTAADFFSTEHPLYNNLHIFGYGFSNDELQMLGETKLILHTSIINGITAIDWNRKVEKGKNVLIQGTYANHTSFPVTLLLNGFNTILDSVTFPSKKETPFSFHFIPKQNGKAVYSLFAIHEKDTLEKESVPVEVITPLPVKVLMLAASPDFENKFLKDWLSQNGYTVVTKTAISTNKFDKIFLNTGNISLEHVTSSLLDSFDVLLSDETTLLSLSRSEQENIYSQVSRKGLGMIIKSDTIASAKEWFTSSFQLYGLPGKQLSQLTMQISNAMTNASLPVEQPLFMRYKNGMQSLITDSANNIVTGVVAEGTGKIVFTTLNNTYSWLLSGSTVNYYSLWSELLQKASRKKIPGVWIETSPALPIAQQPVSIISGTNDNTTPQFRIDGNRISFAQNENLAYRWHGMYWPAREGWQTGFSSQGIINNWYVYNAHDWQSVSAINKMKGTRLYAQHPGESIKNEWIAVASLPVPVPMVYFFVPFIICCTFLWMERKIF